MTEAGRSATVTAWVWGGGLLIASALLPIIATSSLNDPATRATVGWIGTLAFTSALLLFAFGWRGRGSVVAGRPAGVIAMTVWGMSGPLSAVTAALLPPYDDASAGIYEALYYVELLVWLAAGIVSVVAIARAGVVPPPWNRAPAWAFAAIVGVGVAMQIAMVGVAGRPDSQDALLLLSGADSLVRTVVPLSLGILALVVGLRGEPQPETRPSVQVYPPTS